MSSKKRRMKATVHKVIKSHPLAPEKAQINISEADELYREVRIENELTDEAGEKAKLKPGADVDVVIEANSDAIIIKEPD